ncbi:enoyl-CoA hydratase-related protein [Mycolicibacter hiberniae]|uniref:enoyl-CoA hydratase-related protein n=1 Tax=Mycolicibacter hiberniae TaxID=29314 RepID=UPI000A15CE69|nr:enoyl-CoA hydratase-related protein [Mycolicibacter hiberniae]MCV7086775.1 enoyl-CoA hydratase/isomerase family protein [Mycolicibacter hiberniae]ORV71039.1 enoyl-CoA hydratase [Mycolicibacter hiberniae]
MVSETSSAKLTATRDGRVLRVTITNPGRLNAIDYATMTAIGDVFSSAAEDRNVRAVVLTGEGKAFCTGADLSATAGGVSPEEVMDCAARLVTSVAESPLPVIARVNGPVAGVGVGLALAADLIYAVESAYFLLSFTNIGLMPDGGTTALVAAAAGRAVANEMALLGERLPATAARDAGLINAVLSDAELDARVEAAAEKLAHGPRRALELTKRALNATNLAALDAALAREKAGQVELLTSPDFFEGATAMLQKRKAVFGE